MRPSLTAEMADIVVQERIAAAERFRRQREAKRSAAEPDRYEAVTVRIAHECDAAALRSLVARDGGAELRAPILVAEAEGKMLAARSLSDGRSTADPSRHTAHLAELLALRAVHLRVRSVDPKRPRFRRRLSLARRFGHS